MSECLTDMQIALLVAGRASRALRRVLNDHLLACDECRRLVAACVMAERLDSPSVDREADAGPVTVGNDPPWIRDIVETMAGAERPTVDSGTLRRIVTLEWLARDEGTEAPVLAAAPRTERIAGLPTLASADRQVLVHFRRPDPDGPIVAYVIRQGGEGPAGLHLALPERGLSFPVAPDGTAPLPGLDVEELVGLSIQLELAPLGPEARE